MALNITLEDNTGGAQFYYNPDGVAYEPSWASMIPFLGKIGDHLFFGSGVSAAASGAIETVTETVSSITETFEENIIGAIEVLKQYSNVTVLILMGLGIGLVLELRKKKK